MAVSEQLGKSQSDVLQRPGAGLGGAPAILILVLAAAAMFALVARGASLETAAWAVLMFAAIGLLVRAPFGFALVVLLLLAVGVLDTAGLMDPRQGVQIGVSVEVLAWEGGRAFQAGNA